MVQTTNQLTAHTEECSHAAKGAQTTNATTRAKRILPVSRNILSQQPPAQNPQASKSDRIRQRAGAHPQASQGCPPREQDTNTSDTRKDPNHLTGQEAIQRLQIRRGGPSGQNQAAPGQEGPQRGSDKQQAPRGAQASQHGSNKQQTALDLHASRYRSNGQQRTTLGQQNSQRGLAEQQPTRDPHDPGGRKAQQQQQTSDLARFFQGLTSIDNDTPSKRKRTMIPSTNRQNRKIQLDCFLEVQLYPKSIQPYLGIDMPECLQKIADIHNQEVRSPHHQMIAQNWQHELPRQMDNKKWVIGKDDITTVFGPVWVNLTSPLFHVNESRWLQDLTATWQHLERHYDITETGEFSDFYVALDPAYTLQELKRFSQAAVHFEEALCTAIPDSQASTVWRHNPQLMNLSKAEAFSLIDSRQTIEQLITIMDNNEDGRYSYYWRFRDLTQSTSKRYIRNSGLPNPTSAREAMTYSLLTIYFVKASINCASSQELLHFEPDFGGLLRFLRTLGTQDLA